MTDQEAIDLYNNLIKEFGTVPNPLHYPKAFLYYVNLYRYSTERQKQQNPA